MWRLFRVELQPNTSQNEEASVNIAMAATLCVKPAAKCTQLLHGNMISIGAWDRGCCCTKPLSCQNECMPEHIQWPATQRKRPSANGGQTHSCLCGMAKSPASVGDADRILMQMWSCACDHELALQREHSILPTDPPSEITGHALLPSADLNFRCSKLSCSECGSASPRSSINGDGSKECVIKHQRGLWTQIIAYSKELLQLEKDYLMRDAGDV